MLKEYHGAIPDVNHKEVVWKSVGPPRARRLAKKKNFKKLNIYIYIYINSAYGEGMLSAVPCEGMWHDHG